MATKMLLAGIVALCFSVALASVAPDQDFCVGDPRAQTLVNGMACKDPKLVTIEDFFFTGFDKPGNTSNPMGMKVTSFNVGQIPGLNTLGVSMVRMDFAPGGINAPHTHPRASELLAVLEGTLEVGFITAMPVLRHFRKVLQKGDMFVFPFGLIHYQKNVGKKCAVAVAALNSQNAGVIPVAASLLHSSPVISDDTVAKVLQLEKELVKSIQSKL